MNQLCRVCGEPAAGFHFGAFTCEGCKSFFGRTYNNLGSISECKNGGVCVINKKNRTACKACRLRKCLMVGMSKSGSRYGRRSNWFKIHCLLQEQTHQAQTRLKDPKSPYEKVFSSLDAANNNDDNDNDNDVHRHHSHHRHHHHLHNPHQPHQHQQQHQQHRLHHHHPSHRNDGSVFHERLSKREDATRSQELPGVQDLPRGQDIARTHDLIRPEAARFPIWRGPSFFHPALTHMQLLNSPFFPFPQRFVVPYANQVADPGQVTSLSSSSSDSVTPRSTPSPKLSEEANPEKLQNRQDRLGRSVDASYDRSLAFLRSLGPEQEEPMDLSTKKTSDEKKEEVESTDTDDDRSSVAGDNDNQESEAGPPLDLTRKT
ncbi:uncharacterized protein LOC107263877 isoform X2 [Cephus cinctus]|nr:uncharacterized protein LOC107263877 isoform X2 [Cephus cinctus]XP_024936989.1 uncharacterized protein LOC107263877 isoform X2 [Cephus cinctus]